jgi:dodecin
MASLLGKQMERQRTTLVQGRSAVTVSLPLKPHRTVAVCGRSADADEGGEAMAVVKVIELLGESEQSWEDAAQQVVAEATRTLHGVTSVYIKEFQATVENDRVKNYRVNAKVSFVLERK